MKQIVNISYFGEIAMLLAALCWSIAVIIFKSASKSLSPLVIVALKNSIAIIFFTISFILLDIPLFFNGFIASDYLKIIISGIMGMGIGDILFIYALSKIGANRVAIVNCFEPAVIYCFSIIMLGTFLTIQQLVGFIIVVISLLIISYEKDIDDINPIIKRNGLIVQIIAVMFSSFGIVLIKPVLEKATNSIEVQLWITAFRLFPGFIVAWIVLLFQKNKISLLKPLKNSSILWKMLMGSGLGTFIALSFWIIGYANIEHPPVASIVGQTSVIFIVILSYLFLKEKISKLRIVSIFLAMCGVIVITLK